MTTTYPGELCAKIVEFRDERTTLRDERTTKHPRETWKQYEVI